MCRSLSLLEMYVDVYLHMLNHQDHRQYIYSTISEELNVSSFI